MDAASIGVALCLMALSLGEDRGCGFIQWDYRYLSSSRAVLSRFTIISEIKTAITKLSNGEFYLGTDTGFGCVSSAGGFGLSADISHVSTGDKSLIHVDDYVEYA